jgi:hypothetical protein
MSPPYMYNVADQIRKGLKVYNVARRIQAEELGLIEDQQAHIMQVYRKTICYASDTKGVMSMMEHWGLQGTRPTRVESVQCDLKRVELEFKAAVGVLELSVATAAADLAALSSVSDSVNALIPAEYRAILDRPCKVAKRAIRKAHGDVQSAQLAVDALQDKAEEAIIEVRMVLRAYHKSRCDKGLHAELEFEPTDFY